MGRLGQESGREGVPVADAAVWEGALQCQRGRCRQLVLELVVMATDTTVLAAGSGVGRGDVARWQHREQLRWTGKYSAACTRQARQQCGGWPSWVGVPQGR